MSATLTAPPAPSAPVTQTPPPAPVPSQPYYLSMSTLRRFTLAEYHKMIETGVLVSGEPYELLEGWIVRKMSRGKPHDNGLMVLTKRFLRMMGPGWEVRPQCAVTLSDDSEPEPDFAIVRGDENTFTDHHPGPSEIALLVEVSDSSVRVDRHDKGRIYSRDRIPVYWVVDIPDQRIEVYTLPGGSGDTAAYQHRQDYGLGSSVPVVIDGQAVGTVAVSDVIK